MVKNNVGQAAKIFRIDRALRRAHTLSGVRRILGMKGFQEVNHYGFDAGQERIVTWATPVLHQPRNAHTEMNRR